MPEAATGPFGIVRDSEIVRDGERW